jgi:hypothetical protein
LSVGLPPAEDSRGGGAHTSITKIYVTGKSWCIVFKVNRKDEKMKPQQNKAPKGKGGSQVWKKRIKGFASKCTVAGVALVLANVSPLLKAAYHKYLDDRTIIQTCVECRPAYQIGHALGKLYVDAQVPTGSTNAPNPGVQDDIGRLLSYAPQFRGLNFADLKSGVLTATPTNIESRLRSFDPPFQKDAATDAAYKLGWQLYIYPKGGMMAPPAETSESVREKVNAELKQLGVRGKLPKVTNRQQLNQQLEALKLRLKPDGLALNEQPPLDSLTKA